MRHTSRILVATLWVGTLWAIGFIAAPTLFSTLDDRVLAGNIAGNLFRAMAWLSVACGTFLLMTQRVRQHTFFGEKSPRSLHWIIIAMMTCTVLSYFCLQPLIAELRTILHASQDMAQIAQVRRQFGWLHGISTAFHVVQSLLGAVLILKIR